MEVDENIIIGTVIVVINLIPFILKKPRWLSITGIISLLIVLLGIMIN
ncbi:MAG: hypothetical protein KJ592_00120 [Nanoarchaeota archaeon]|nr:hypothetical protein [Nanoarchaeota archaeon]